MNYESMSRDYARIEQAILFLEGRFRERPSLQKIANYLGLSEHHFQRLFSRWAGVSPKRFLQYLTKEHAKNLLRKTKNLLEASLEAGLSGESRLHDLLVSCEAVTPGQYASQGQGMKIEFGFRSSPFGMCLIALTARGICHLSFLEKGRESSALEKLKQHWSEADLIEGSISSGKWVNKIFDLSHRREPLHLLLKGTNFQMKVWEALLHIPPATVISYEEISRGIGLARSARAVGNAVGQNPVAYLIPCHRVIRKVGEFGDYQWGTARKKAILGWEMSRSTAKSRIN